MHQGSIIGGPNFLAVDNKRNSAGILDDESLLCPTPPNRDFQGPIDFNNPQFGYASIENNPQINYGASFSNLPATD